MNIAQNVFQLPGGKLLSTHYMTMYEKSGWYCQISPPGKIFGPYPSEQVILATYDYPPLCGAGTAEPLQEWPTPTQPGYRWAKWRKADQGDPMTAEYETYLPLDSWSIVEVYDNLDSLRVFLHGVIDSQSLGNFIWGPAVTEKAP